MEAASLSCPWVLFGDVPKTRPGGKRDKRVSSKVASCVSSRSVANGWVQVGPEVQCTYVGSYLLPKISLGKLHRWLVCYTGRPDFPATPPDRDGSR